MQVRTSLSKMTCGIRYNFVLKSSEEITKYVLHIDCSRFNPPKHA